MRHCGEWRQKEVQLTGEKGTRVGKGEEDGQPEEGPEALRQRGGGRKGVGRGGASIVVHLLVAAVWHVVREDVTSVETLKAFVPAKKEDEKERIKEVKIQASDCSLQCLSAFSSACICLEKVPMSLVDMLSSK